MHYPNTRMRRLRSCKSVRSLFSENVLIPSNLILPIFVMDEELYQIPVHSMPGVYTYSIKGAIDIAKDAYELGIKAICLFPKTKQEDKDELASFAYNEENLMCNAIKAIKEAVPDLCIIADVALDPYTKSGHDGIYSKCGKKIDNDATVAILIKQSISLAKSGCDIIAPSDMMDGRVLRIREALEENNFCDTQIMSYAVKYASNLYSPFRDAVGSSVNIANASKSEYQLNILNSKEAMREIELDIKEGADSIIIKPTMLYLDIIATAFHRFDLPIIGYQVSGEYAAIKFASMNGAINYKAAMLESLMCAKRAGCRAIITYAALDVARWIQ